MHGHAPRRHTGYSVTVLTGVTTEYQGQSRLKEVLERRFVVLCNVAPMLRRSTVVDRTLKTSQAQRVGTPDGIAQG